MKITFKVSGLKELDAALARLPKAYAKNILRKAWSEAAAPLVADIKANAPVDTGALRDSIRVGRMGGESATEAKMQVGVFGEFYGHFQEFGTVRQPARPFVRPAIDRHAAGLVERFRKLVGESIERAMAKQGAGIFERSRLGTGGMSQADIASAKSANQEALARSFGFKTYKDFQASQGQARGAGNIDNQGPGFTGTLGAGVKEKSKL